MEFRRIILAAALAGSLTERAPAQFSQQLVPGTSFKGSISAAFEVDSFQVSAVSGTRLDVSVTGKKGLRPLVRVQDLSSGLLLAEVSAAKATASVKQLALPSTGAYRVTVAAADATITGAYTGKSSAKVPAAAQNFKIPPGGLSPSQDFEFEAVAGARLSGSIDVTTGEPAPVPWIALFGPTGVVPVDAGVAVLKQGKRLKLKSLVLPATGPYVILLQDQTLTASAKLKLKPPAAAKGNVPILASPQVPVLDPLPTVTSGASIDLTGAALTSGSTIRVLGGASEVTGVSGGDLRFALSVPLVPNALNKLFVTETPLAGPASPPVPVLITRDSSGPEVFLDFPMDGEILTSDTITVAGRVADHLSGFLGLTVAVNGIAATVDSGVGTNGTFEASGVPLKIGAVTDIEVIATDALGNQSTASGSVMQIPPTAARIEAVSGGGQSAKVDKWLAEPLTVKVFGNDGLPLAGKVVTFEVIRSDGSLAGQKNGAASRLFQATTNGSGVAKAWYRLGHDAGCGNNRARARATGIPGTAYFCAAALPGLAGRVSIGTGDRQTARVASPLPEPLKAWVSDGRNGCAGETVRFRVLNGGGFLIGPAGVTSTDLSVKTDSTGHAEVRLVLGDASTEQRVQATLKGASADGVEFTAYAVPLSTEPRPTAFFGVVLDNASRPIGNATCRLDLAGASLTTASNAAGQFRFDGLADSGPAHLHVDGSTADLLGGAPFPAAIGQSFPSLEYQVLIVPDADNALPMPVYLPLQEAGASNSKQFDNTADVVLTLPGIEGLEFRFRAAPGAHHMHPNGQPVTPGNPITVSVHQVKTDDIPMPVPDGAAPPFAWTLQPGGAHFDPPVEVKYPNVVGLPPGAITYFLSFDHSTQKFEIVSTGHVLEDGSASVTDLGDGIATAGWGGQCPPYPPSGDAENDPCEDAAETLQDAYEAEASANSSTSALAHQIACLAQTACSDGGFPPELEDCATDSPIPDILNDIAQNALNPVPVPNLLSLLLKPWTNAGLAVEFACALLPGSWGVAGVMTVNDLCSIYEGLGSHFPYELVPGFWKYAKDLKPGSPGAACHDYFLQNIVTSCFGQVDEFSPLAQDVGAALVPALASATRKATVAIWCALHGDPTNLAALPPDLIPIPDAADLFNADTDTLGKLKIRQLGGDLFARVGQPFQLSVIFTPPSGPDSDLTLGATGTEYLPLALGDTATVSADGLVTVSSTVSPIANMPMMLYVLVRNGTRFGVGQFAVLGNDQDGDLIADHWETKVGLDPALLNAPDSDLDADGLADIEECLAGTYPLLADSDGDGFEDGDEFYSGSDPKNPALTLPLLDADATVTVGGQSGKATAGGRFKLSNIPANGELGRVYATLTKQNAAGEPVTFYARSPYLEVKDGENVKVGGFEVAATPFPAPVKLAVAACVGGTQVLDQIGEQLQLCAKATLSTGIEVDVSSRTQGTQFTSSNPAIASVDASGLVTAGTVNGPVIISARHEGLTATTIVTVSLGDPGTTVVGRVLGLDGEPAAGATINILGVPVGTSGANGKFTVPGVASSAPISVTAVANGEIGYSAPAVPLPGGITDVGDIVLGAGTCQFDLDVGAKPPSLQSDDTYLQMAFASGFVFPYFGTPHSSVYVGSNGYLTFGEGDSTYEPSIPDDVTDGLPRISAAYYDLHPGPVSSDPAKGLFVKSGADRFVVTWLDVPEYSAGGSNTIQLSVLPSGRIQYLYNGMTSTGASRDISVAVSPGGMPNVLNVTYSNQPFFATTGPTTAPFENFTGANPFDLDFTCITWIPNGAGGFDVSVGPLQAAATEKAAWVVGRVRDARGEGVAGALVQSSAAATRTGLRGDFVLGPFAAGHVVDVAVGGTLQKRLLLDGRSLAVRADLAASAPVHAPKR